MARILPEDRIRVIKYDNCQSVRGHLPKMPANGLTSCSALGICSHPSQMI